MVARYLNRQDPDLILLQKTHLEGNNCGFTGRGPYKVLAHSGFTSGSRGVAILLHRLLPFAVQQVWTDKQGCYVAIQGEWNAEKLVVVSMYFPPGLQLIMLERIGKWLAQAPGGLLVLGGEINLALQHDLDRFTLTGPQV